MGGSRRLAALALAGTVAALATAGIGAAPANAAAGTSRAYYISATGNDALDGTSPATAWRTLQPANSRDLAGDTVLLQGGATFVGPLQLDARDTGVTVGSYGTGRARVVGHNASGIVGYDTSAITVHDLDLGGDSAAYSSSPGLNFYNDLPAGERLDGVTLSHLTVEGFKTGVSIGGANPGAGFSHVSITNVTASGNR
ncbi:MAG: hypothetical protein ACTHK4_16855, partial [Mycobacteriales bacterium]